MAIDIDLIVQLGGAANIGDCACAGWMAREMAYVETAIKHDKPVFSICLGAQMLANMFGARIFRLNTEEKGVYRINVDEPAGVLAAIVQNDGWVFQSHAYAFELPQGATRLAYSAAVPCQAFRVGDRIMATQFHPDATLEVFVSWLIASGRYSFSQVETLTQQARVHAQGIQESSAKMFTTWLEKAISIQGVTSK